MPKELRPKWLDAIGLDATSLGHYLACASALCEDDHEHEQPASIGHPELLFDNALHGAPLTSQQWAHACGFAGKIGMPKLQYDFCRCVIDAMATTHSEHHFEMASALTELPAAVVVNALRDSIEDAPWRAYHSVELLGIIDHPLSGDTLMGYLDGIDPWCERGVAESVRRLIRAGSDSIRSSSVARLQAQIHEHLTDASSWTSRTAFAHLARALGPLPGSLERKLSREGDADVRIAAGLRAEQPLLEAARRLSAEAVSQTLDRMHGAPTNDPLAEQLIRNLMLSADDADQAQASHALSLSAYRSTCEQVLIQLTTDRSLYVRRASARALEFFAPSNEVVEALKALATEDAEGSVRAQATWSLISQADSVSTSTLDVLLADPDVEARRSAVDLAGAAGYNTGLNRISIGDEPRLAKLASFLRGSAFV